MTDKPEAVRRAESRGHHVTFDPPAGMTGTLRWTCTETECGRAVLDYNGNIYGSAIEDDCPAMVESEVSAREAAMETAA